MKTSDHKRIHFANLQRFSARTVEEEDPRENQLTQVHLEKRPLNGSAGGSSCSISCSSSNSNSNRIVFSPVFSVIKNL